MSLKTAAILAFCIIAGLAAGILAGGVFLTVQLGRDIIHLDPLIMLEFPPTFARIQQSPFMESYLIVLEAILLALAIGSVALFVDQLTEYEDAHFQNMRELRKNGMLEEIGAGLLFGRYVEPPEHPKGKPLVVDPPEPKWKALLPESVKGKLLSGPVREPGPFISAHYDKFPNAMLIAPTGAGKTVGYAVPVALTFPGSMVVLDVKGEIFDETARHRVRLGDRVYRLAPFDFENPTHQYNPLYIIAQYKDPEQRYTELAKIASQFLQVDGGGNASSFVGGGRDLFVAAGMLAIERKKPTFGEIYRIIFGTGRDDVGEDMSDRLLDAANEARDESARSTLSLFSQMEAKIRDSYVSVLKEAGLGQWANPKIERITRRNDIDFTTIRKELQSIYLVVASDDIEAMSSLIRLFFTQLIAFLRRSKPGPDEPHPVKILLDEFDQLGHMKIFVNALKQIRGHGGRVSIVTQPVPGLQTVYTADERKSLEAGCGVKLYITANEQTTSNEIEASLGTRTGISVSLSHERTALGPLRGSVTKHSEDRPLLSAQQIERLKDDYIIILPLKQQPILAEKIRHFEDPVLSRLYTAQTGPMPFPNSDEEAYRSRTIDQEVHIWDLEQERKDLRNKLAKLEAERPARDGKDGEDRNPDEPQPETADVPDKPKDGGGAVVAKRQNELLQESAAVARHNLEKESA